MNIYNKEKAKTNNWSFGDLGPLFSEIRNSSQKCFLSAAPSQLEHSTTPNYQHSQGPMQVKGPEA